MQYFYKIEINLHPENFNGNLKYFWCITKNSENSSSNNGHGWSHSVEQATIDANLYYHKNILNKT